MGPGRLPSDWDAKIAVQFGQSCVCVGNRNDFHVFSTSIVVAHILQHDATFARLPPITPDYTRLHLTLNPDYAMSGRLAERLFVREIHS